LKPIENDSFSGFYITTIANDGKIDITGGMEHKKLPNTMLQLTFICPKQWDEEAATQH
jgi:hypothetical protein